MIEETIVNYHNGKPSPLKVVATESDTDSSILIVSLVGIGTGDNSYNCLKILKPYFRYTKIILDLSEYREDHYFLAFQYYLQQYLSKVRIAVVFNSTSCPFLGQFTYLRNEIWHVEEQIPIAASTQEAIKLLDRKYK